MQRQEIATATRHFLRELGTNDVTGTILLAAVKRAGSKVNADTAYNVGEVDFGLDTRVMEYALSGSVLEVHGVRLGTGSTRVRLIPTNRHELDRTNGNWEAATAGTPTKYYTDGPYIGVWPKPHSTAALGTVHVRCVKEPNILTYATSAPAWLPVRYHITLAKEAAIEIARGYGADRQTSPIRLQALYAEYLTEVAEIKALRKSRSDEYTPQLTPKGYETFRRR